MALPLLLYALLIPHTFLSTSEADVCKFPFQLTPSTFSEMMLPIFRHLQILALERI